MSIGILYQNSYKQKVNKGGINMDTKEKILDLFYNQHLKQCNIVETLGVTKQYISKIVKADCRYREEKENRTNINSEKRKTYLKEYAKTYKRKKENDNSYEQLLSLQKQDAIELSYGNGEISDYAYAKWNSSIYHFNKKGNLVIDKNIKVGYDVPHSINMNKKVPTQRYKNCISY